MRLFNHIKIIYFLLIILIISGTATVHCEQDPATLAIDAYNRLDFNEAKRNATIVIENWKDFDPDDLLAMHKLLGIIYYSEGRILDSRNHFEHSISLDPATGLDSVMVSPKIIAFYNTIKSQIVAQNKSFVITNPRYIFLKDQRVDALWRSALYPGWGQRFLGHTKRANVFMSLYGFGAASSIYFYISKEKFHDKYIAERDVVRIESRYNDYNNAHKAFHYATYLTAAVWATSILDIFLSDSVANVPVSHRFGMIPIPNNGYMVTLSIQF